MRNEIEKGRSSPHRPARALALAALVAAVAAASCPAKSADIPRYGVRQVAAHPHDRHAYTQGLIVHGGRFYESTGRRGSSTVREVNIETGEVIRRVGVPFRYFGEGLARVGDHLLQLTWESGEGRVYDLATLDYLRKFTYEGQGWGLASDGERLVMSDGSAVLRFLDPETLTPVGEVEVQADGQPVANLNELEFVGDELFANVWKTPWIARIDPATGIVVGWIDLSGLFDWTKLPDEDAVPNGIAWDAENERLFVTGKLWPKVYEVELVEAESE